MAEIREAVALDMPVILELARQMHSQTLVKEWFSFDVESAIETIEERIAAPQMVVLYDGEGFLMGTLCNPPFDKSVIMAQELGWYHNNKGGARLMFTFEQWAKAKGATIIAMGAMEGGTRDQAVLDRYYRKLGYSAFEHAYAKRIE